MKNICVYCVKENCAFNREHVIPKSFGTFGINTFILNHNEVCKSCNQYFADNLELYLGRDSLEGQFRFKHNIKPEEEFKSLAKKSRMVTKSNEEPFKGVYVERIYSDILNKIETKPLPQAGFLNKDGGFDYFLWNDIPTKDDLEKKGYKIDQKESIRIFGVFNEAEIKNKFTEKGFSNFKTEGIFEPESDKQDIGCEVTEKFDDIKLRVMAKIAFNYLVYFEGKEFCLQKDFDNIRRYVRYGEKCDYQLVLPKQESILSDEPVEGKRRSGHLITVNWATDGVSIIAQVSLMNLFTYCISLAKDHSGEKRNIKRGHFFDPYNKQVIELCTNLKT